MRNPEWSTRGFIALVCISSFAMVIPSAAEAAPAELTYRHKHFLFKVSTRQLSWQTTEDVWLLHGKEVRPPAELRVDGDAVPPLPDGFTRQVREAWNRVAIADTLTEQITKQLNRDPGSVSIGRTATGSITFEGLGLTGRSVDLDATVTLTIAALEQNVPDVLLPVHEVQPTIDIHDPVLLERGIREVVSIGESDFTGSPWARRQNIATGLSKFNGHIIPRGEIFSFNETLGPVNQSTGYFKELVIKGDKTLPDFGGGLCQVSTTAYRGVWEYGFPITQRKNHSYVVKYYSPQGTDATIYPPGIDIKFENDSPGDLLMQTYVDTGSSLAYFIYYGTRDDRSVDLVGPYLWDRIGPPADRTEYTTDIPPGTTRVAGKQVPGVKALWYRILRGPGSEEEVTESVYSVYEARPNFTQIGIAADADMPPDWIGEDVAPETPEPASVPPPPTRFPFERPPRRR